MLFIAPNIVAPRLAEKIYHPRCEAGLKQSWTRAQHSEQQRLNDLYAQKRAEIKRKRQMAEDMLDQTFGGLGQQLKALGLFDSFDTLSQQMQPPRKGSAKTDLSSETAQQYCGCVITELLGDKVATGLYSASLRLWTPKSIHQLENADKHPVRVHACPQPDFLKD